MPVSSQGESKHQSSAKPQCSPSPSVKRYVRKGIPNEHRALIWMAASGAQDQLEKNPGHYQSLLGAQHDPKLVEAICTGQGVFLFPLLLSLTFLKNLHTHQADLKELASVETYTA